MPVAMLSSSLITEPKRYGRFNALDTENPFAEIIGPGMVLMKPTSVDKTGTSATISADGGVTFSALEVLSLNNVFTADFNNYMMVMQASISPTASDINLRLRASGTDNSDSVYDMQQLLVNNTSTTGSRSSNQNIVRFMTFSGTYNNNANQMFFYRPFLAEPTAMRHHGVRGDGSFEDWAYHHGNSASYDGFTISTENGDTITGTITVYGLRS